MYVNDDRDNEQKGWRRVALGKCCCTFYSQDYIFVLCCHSWEKLLYLFTTGRNPKRIWNYNLDLDSLAFGSMVQ